MDLQTALALIGIVIVVAVALTTFDKDRVTERFRRVRAGAGRASDAPPVTRREPLIEIDVSPPLPLAADTRLLPTEAAVEDNVIPTAPPGDAIDSRLSDIEAVARMSLNLNPGFDPPGTGPAAAALDSARPIAALETIDFIVVLPGPGPIKRQAALGVFRQNEYLLNRRPQLYGRRYNTEFWSTLEYDSEATRYSDLKLAVPLVDAQGPISDSELNVFVQIGLKLADTLARSPAFSLPFEGALAHARTLQKFIEDYDVIAAVNVAAEDGKTFAGRSVPQAAGRFGLQLGAMDIFHKKADDPLGSRNLFSLSNAYKPGTFDAEHWDDFKTPGLTLFMNVPCVHRPGEVYTQMIEAAVGLCEALAGRLLDQNRRPLTGKGIETIRVQIEGIERAMNVFGIPPGSEAALRLFDMPSKQR